MFGVYLASFTKTWAINQPSPILALLFSTTLAPVAGRFGPVAGIIAGYLHSSVALNVGIVYGGMNLYNNGFAGGIGPHARLVRHIGLLRRGKRQQHGREDRKQSGSHFPVIGCRPLAVKKIRLIAQLWAHPCSGGSILAEAERSIQTATTAGNKFSYLCLNHFHGHYSGKETAK